MSQIKKENSNTKDLRLEVKNLLIGSLNHLKEMWGEKKFNNKIDEAAKLLTKGLKKEEKAPTKVSKKGNATTTKAKTVADKKEIKKVVKVSEETTPKAIVAPKKSPAKKDTKKSTPSVSK